MKIEIMNIDDYDKIYSLWKTEPWISLKKSDEKNAINSYLKRNNELSFVIKDNNKIIATIMWWHDRVVYF